jgi:hypothetical protein
VLEGGLRRLAVFCCSWALAIVAAGEPAGAAIPSALKLADAAAEANRAAGRAAPLRFEVTLRIGAGEPVAKGELWTHPTGLARLELRHRDGFVERHLLQGSAYNASRDGKLLGPLATHPFLPPVFLLQATSGVTLRAALGSFEVASEEVALGRVEDHDCYVFGGRLPRTPEGQEQRLPSLWIDLESYEVLRIDRGDGVRFEIGPTDDLGGGIRVPRWIAIETQDQDPARLEILRVAPAVAPASAFGTDWLTAPQIP